MINQINKYLIMKLDAGKVNPSYIYNDYLNLRILSGAVVDN